MPSTTITTIETPLAEQSDYVVTGTLVGPDGVTPVEPSAVSTLTATLRSADPGVGAGTVIFSNRDVKSYLAALGVFEMPLLYSDLTAIGDRPLQDRLLTLKLVQTNGKRRNQVIAFKLENFVDV